MKHPYHHGDLRAELLSRAVAVIEHAGVEALSLRALAREADVSHTAPLHHFASKTGLVTAVAAEGFRRLAFGLREAGAEADFVEVGVAYVHFAATFPAHFSVMFRPALLDLEDADLLAAQQEAFAVLRGGVDAMAAQGTIDDAAAAVIAGWSLVHGLATLLATGNLDGAKLRELVREQDPASLTRRAAGMLYGSPGSDANPGGR